MKWNFKNEMLLPASNLDRISILGLLRGIDLGRGIAISSIDLLTIPRGWNTIDVVVPGRLGLTEVRSRERWWGRAARRRKGNNGPVRNGRGTEEEKWVVMDDE